MVQGKPTENLSFSKRKQLLKEICSRLPFSLVPDPGHPALFQMIPFENDFCALQEKIRQNGGEGIVAKLLSSRYERKRSPNWLKLKNWKRTACLITAYNKVNGYFRVGVWKGKNIVNLGGFKNGLRKEEREALIRVMRKNRQSEDETFLYVPPGIVIEILFLEWNNGEFREPYFSRFLFERSPESCTESDFFQSIRTFPMEISHPEKQLWKNPSISKMDYLFYLDEIYPYIAPFLKDRPLTVIRFPHGLFGEGFFQKNGPEQVPDYVETACLDGIRYILCNNRETFLWLGNRLALEFHIPFRKVHSNQPAEIVIDLDPPTRNEFPLAVKAARLIKEEIVDRFGLAAFLKVSGNRGLQIYFPLSENSGLDWKDTRLFTKFIARYCVSTHEQLFTLERLKEKRGNKLYIDYVQQGEGKTIIAPYSVRANERAGVAAPLYWEELTADVKPDGFSMDDVLHRLKTVGDPLKSYFSVDNDEPIKKMIRVLRNEKP